MAVEINEVEQLQQYMRGVMERADHHAPEVANVFLAIVGAVVWCKTAPIQVRSRDGELKNVLWVDVGGRGIAFTYNHELRTIDVKDGSLKGPSLASFDNSSTNEEVRLFFESLTVPVTDA
jgi:hypothetical protein